MRVIKNQTFDEERALYGSNQVEIVGCQFDGDADGESACKECSNLIVDDCYFNLRYPFWHNHTLSIKESTFTENCRAALWYSSDITIDNTNMLGIKALRECHHVKINDCTIQSPEFGWSVDDIEMNRTYVISEYFMLRSSHLTFNYVNLIGKYSFQYIEDSVFSSCVFNTKDAFWHAKNITIKDSVLKGEYLAWYCENVTFDNCTIIGTQPLCYCKKLKLINCRMIDCDLSFEKSEVEATITSSVTSIKNPYKGTITVKEVDELIMDDEHAKGVVIAG
jgi:hypothetical protein